MIAKTTKVTDGPRGLVPIGTEVSHRDAWRLVVLGVAVPADKECQDTLDALTEQQVARDEHRAFVADQRSSATPAPIVTETPEPEVAAAPAETEWEHGV